MEEDITLGGVIRSKRKAQKLTLVEMGKKTGLTQGYLSNIENNVRTRPSVEVLKKIADALNVSRTALMTIAGYVEESELEVQKNIILREREMFGAANTSELNTSTIVLNDVIDAAYLNTKFIYSGKELNIYEKTYISQILYMILENPIPEELTERKKIIELLEFLLK
ncbi:helix-turn-helix transcriptional regulator [Sporosarcina jeotgali]|uniref:Helix-turn-helix transcriptional regulator n=1 Tax=Sporosarcina jeotgali TaxID=3020056 RepID=A0ABZ0KWV8_9BACL|nr:helix-turn-helix transcriptional regulator [Sporosarcina sp. B2O-1]WOV83921.1 helix-turn-helix transcriptional regulator [Sporosarcina sp. B2O-1]